MEDIVNRDDILASLGSAAKRYLPEGRELRVVPVNDIEVRQDENGLPSLNGHAAVFNTETNIGGFFREKIADGAFTKTIKEADVRMLFNHNPDLVLARTKNGTLDLREDDIGLVYEGRLNPKDPDAVSVAAKVERGDVSQSSFAFRVIADEWRETEEPGGLPLRTVTEAQLFDVSPVTYPAYEETDVGVRAAALGILSSVIGLSEAQRELVIGLLTENALPEEIDARMDDILAALAETREACERDEEIPAADEAPEIEAEDEAGTPAEDEAESDELDEDADTSKPEDDGDQAAEEAPGDETEELPDRSAEKLAMLRHRQRLARLG